VGRWGVGEDREMGDLQDKGDNVDKEDSKRVTSPPAPLLTPVATTEGTSATHWLPHSLLATPPHFKDAFLFISSLYCGGASAMALSNRGFASLVLP
jgi:hypothetical protein